jgi:probable HAF family extracellular repeat protein
MARSTAFPGPGGRSRRVFTSLLLLLGILAAVAATDSGRRSLADNPGPAGTPYTILDLGVRSSKTDAVSSAEAINNRGQVVGVSDTNARGPYGFGRLSRAFLWDSGRLVGLGGGTSFDRSAALAINEQGQIAGGWSRFTLIGQSGGAELWEDADENGEFSPDEAVDLGYLDENVFPPYSFAYGINDQGQVVGTSRTVDESTQHAFLWQDGRMIDLTGPGERMSAATDINTRGQVVGYGGHALLWEDRNGNGAADGSETLDLGTLGGEFSFAEAINERGQVVGGAALPSGASHAFSWQDRNGNHAVDPGELIDLGSPGERQSIAEDVNNNGRVVGYAFRENQDGNEIDRRAFVWEDVNRNITSDPGEMIDLNTLLPPRSGWVLERASGINDRGQIVGEGRHNGRLRAFLMTPVLPGPDLTGAWGRVSEVTFGKGLSRRVTVRGAFRVVSQGTVAAPASRLRVYLSNDATLDASDTLLADLPVRALPSPGGITLHFRARLKEGRSSRGRFFLAVADAPNTVREGNEVNNLRVLGPVP